MANDETVRYEPSSPLGPHAKCYMGTTSVVLPGGLELVCASHAAATALHSLINLLVVEQRREPSEGGKSG